MSEAKHTPLLPCPFCGGEASGDSKVTYSDSHVKEEGWNQSTFFYVNCIRCGSDNKGIIGHRTRDEAIAAWNCRSTDATIAEMKKALERANVLVNLVTVRQVIEAGDRAIEAAGLNPWCMNEGLADGSETISPSFIDASLSGAQS